MFEQLNFYFRHSLNDLRVNGRRTFFALLCIAAGVAAIVSLQTVAAMISDTLTGNLQATNRGDIQISQPLGGGFVNEAGGPFEAGANSGFLEEVQPTGPFAPPNAVGYKVGQEGIRQLRAWIDENYPGQIDLTYRLEAADIASVFTGSGMGTNLNDPAKGTAASSLTPVMIDPQVYPYYSTISSTEGKPLADLIQSPTDIVIDKKAAETLKAEIGDTIRISGSDTDFTIRGFVPTDAEVTDPFTGIFAALFGFYYLDADAAQFFDTPPQYIDKIYLRLQDSARVSEVNNALLQEYPFLNTTTIDDLKVQNQEIATQINQLVTIMGLISLLLGSIGIINTMQVIVRRRTVEVAVLKTIGLQAGQVTILFLVEAFLMGIVGSLAGIILGWLTTFAIKGVAENLVAQSLNFRIVPLAAVNGLIVGTLVTTIFGFLPTLAAGQVRPGTVLRPNDDIIPRAGCLQTLLALGAIVIALSLVIQTIIGSFGLAVGVTIGAFIAAGVLFAVLSFLIWLIGRFFPSLGIVDLKISLRQMLAARSRAAVTLLALVVGVFSLSLITLFADSINQLLSFALGEGSGGNVLVTTAAPPMLQQVETKLQSLEGVRKYQVLRTYDGTLLSLEEADGTVLTPDQIKDRIRTNAQNGLFGALAGDSESEFDMSDVLFDSLGQVSGREIDQLGSEKIETGRQLTADDEGQPVMVIQSSQAVTDAGIGLGDKLTFQFGDDPDAKVTFEVVGMSAASIARIGGGGGAGYVPNTSIPSAVQPTSIVTMVDIADEQIPELRRQLGAVPGTFVLETAFFTKLLTSLLGTFTAFPTMVALLGLIVGGVVIANSVALATLERRREIAVMKAVGLQRERVLGMLLLENAVLGLIGGLVGVGIGLLALIMLLSLGGGAAQAIPFGSALVLMGVCILVALIAAATTAWGASGERPLNVLRYE